MAVPLLHGEAALGVLEVLDRPEQERFTLAEIDLLGLFANQAAIALELLRRARRAKEALEGAGDEAGRVARLAEAVADLPEERRAAGLELLAALEKLLKD
jgi:GAF domain-containing protein